jgi:hypothetical protein
VFFKPPILALFIGSFLISGMLLYSAFYAIQILSKWDIHSGSDTQLNLERRTYLVSTIMAYALAFQLFSFFLFIYTADHLHTFFTGAMCAAGSLNANKWGYPVVLLKVANFLLAGLWLIVNYADNRGYDYPLIKAKYTLLLWITPLILVEAVIQGLYFGGLKPEVITSCCGTQFTAETTSIASEVIALPLTAMEIAFFGGMVGTLGLGIFFYRTGKGGYFLGGASLLTFLISVAALISFISIYIYELPTHHCPFCILQQEYHYLGYPLYLTLLGGALTGLGAGVLMPFRQVPSLKEILPSIQKRLSLFSLLFYAAFTLIVVYEMIFSNLRM